MPDKPNFFERNPIFLQKKRFKPKKENKERIITSYSKILTHLKNKELISIFGDYFAKLQNNEITNKKMREFDIIIKLLEEGMDEKSVLKIYKTNFIEFDRKLRQMRKKPNSVLVEKQRRLFLPLEEAVKLSSFPLEDNDLINLRTTYLLEIKKLLENKVKLNHKLLLSLAKNLLDKKIKQQELEKVKREKKEVKKNKPKDFSLPIDFLENIFIYLEEYNFDIDAVVKALGYKSRSSLNMSLLQKTGISLGLILRAYNKHSSNFKKHSHIASGYFLDEDYKQKLKEMKKELLNKNKEAYTDILLLYYQMEFLEGHEKALNMFKNDILQHIDLLPSKIIKKLMHKSRGLLKEKSVLRNPKIVYFVYEFVKASENIIKKYFSLEIDNKLEDDLNHLLDDYINLFLEEKEIPMEFLEEKIKKLKQKEQNFKYEKEYVKNIDNLKEFLNVDSIKYLEHLLEDYDLQTKNKYIENIIKLLNNANVKKLILTINLDSYEERFNLEKDLLDTMLNFMRKMQNPIENVKNILISKLQKDLKTKEKPKTTKTKGEKKKRMKEIYKFGKDVKNEELIEYFDLLGEIDFNPWPAINYIRNFGSTKQIGIGELKSHTKLKDRNKLEELRTKFKHFELIRDSGKGDKTFLLTNRGQKFISYLNAKNIVKK